MKTPISFRLRKDIDADLIQALSDVDRRKLADLCRNGLRLMVGIRTSKQAQIVERPIMPEPEIRAKIGGGTAKPYIPKEARK